MDLRDIEERLRRIKNGANAGWHRDDIAYELETLIAQIERARLIGRAA